MITTWHNKSKDDWRGWLWNRFAERVTFPDRRNAVGLYLPGIDDAERPVAESKGFNVANLIGIERDEKVAKALRQKHVLLVCGDVESVTLSWPNDWPVRFASMDFYNGIEVDVMSFTCAVTHMPAFDRCVVGVNLLRGRDPLIKNFSQRNGVEHRGRFLIEVLLHEILARFWSVPEGETGRRVFTRKGRKYVTTNRIQAIPRSIWAPMASRLFKPAYFSYKSDNQWFDSVVFNWDHGRWLKFVWCEVAKVPEKEFLDYMKSISFDQPVFCPRTKRRISAIRAIHTRRQA